MVSSGDAANAVKLAAFDAECFSGINQDGQRPRRMGSQMNPSLAEGQI